jgi:hypothetical protein
MRIPTWRLVLTGGTIVILLALGIGFVAASGNTASTPANAGLAAATAAPDASAKPERPDHPRFKAWFGGRAGKLALAKHLVHATATFTDKDGNLVTIQLDHGTVQAIGNGSLTIAEAGGSTVTVSTDDKTDVYLGREEGALSDLKVGDTVFVQSRVDGATLAKRILRVPATATDDGS